MDCESIFGDRYGCTCDSETVIFCFNKRTGDWKWSCSGHCFERPPSQTIATQTENTDQSFPTLQQKTSHLTEMTEIIGVDKNKEIASLMSNAITVCAQEMRSQAGISVAVSHTSSPDQVIHVSCVSDNLGKPKALRKTFVAYETCNQVRNTTGNEEPGSLFDDVGNNKDDTLDIGKDYENCDDSGNDHGDDSTSEDGYSIGVDNDGKRDIPVDVTIRNDNNDKNQNHDKRGDDGKDDKDNLVNECYESEILKSPTKVRKSIKRKQTKGKVPREVFPCTYCTRKCTSKSLYDKHIEWHTRSKETKCNICGKEFSKPGYLINHLEKHQQARKQGEENEKKLSECRYCGKLMKGENLDGHEKTHTQSKQKRLMECSYCGKTFTSSSEFERHVRTHTKEKPYKCCQCESAFYCNGDLTIHIRRHLGDKRYKCDHCGKAFVRKCNLDEHLRTHTGARPYGCQYCDKTFGFRNVLKVHLLQHTGVRPHICEYCNKGFAKKAFLDKHLIVHN